MKSIKNILNLMWAVALPVVLLSCDGAKEAEYTPSYKPSGSQVYFSNNLDAAYDLTDNAGELDITLNRAVTTDALSVPISATANSIFTVASTAEFAAGSKTAAIKITFDPASLEDDENYEISLSVGKETTIYGLSTYTFTATKPSSWIPFGTADSNGMTGTYSDNMNNEYEFAATMEYQNLGNGVRKCRVIGYYQGSPYAEEDFTWDTTTNYIRIPMQYIFSSSYGYDGYIGDYVSYCEWRYGSDYWASSSSYTDWDDYYAKKGFGQYYYYDGKGGFYLSDSMWAVYPDGSYASAWYFNGDGTQNTFIANGFVRKTDYNTAYAYKLKYSGTVASYITSTDGTANEYDAQLRYNEDEGIWYIPSYFTASNGLAFVTDAPEDLSATSEISDVANEQATGLVLLGQNVYVKVKKGTVSLDAAGLPTFNMSVNAFSMDESGATLVDFGNFSETFTATSVPEVYTYDDLNAASSVDDFYGTYNTTYNDYYEDGEIGHGTVTLSDGGEYSGYQYVKINGLTGWDGYSKYGSTFDDGIYGLYYKGVIYLYAQDAETKLKYGSTEYDVTVYPYSSSEDDILSSDDYALLGGFAENGKLIFVPYGSTGIYDGFATYCKLDWLNIIYNVFGEKQATTRGLTAAAPKQLTIHKSLKTASSDVKRTFNPSAGVANKPNKNHRAPMRENGKIR